MKSERERKGSSNFPRFVRLVDTRGKECCFRMISTPVVKEKGLLDGRLVAISYRHNARIGPL